MRRGSNSTDQIPNQAFAAAAASASSWCKFWSSGNHAFGSSELKTKLPSPFNFSAFEKEWNQLPKFEQKKQVLLLKWAAKLQPTAHLDPCRCANLPPPSPSYTFALARPLLLFIRGDRNGEREIERERERGDNTSWESAFSSRTEKEREREQVRQID